ncbi:translation elongation factor Ts [Thermodesulfobacteriota bacterium]
MAITAKQVKDLRDKTGLGMMDCKKALVETDGDIDKAVEYLRTKGALKAEKRGGRTTSEGRIGSYVHMTGKIGVMVELKCESDFVAKTDDFSELAKDLCMHVAASAPRWISKDEVPEDVIAKEKEIYMNQAKEAGKPEKILGKIAEGKLKKFFSENCLLEQAFVKDTDITIEQLVKDKIAKLGENMTIGRFVRYQLGEEA